MNQEIFKKKEVKIALWVVVAIALVAFFWLTAPKTAPKNTTNANVNAVVAPATNVNVPANVNANANTNKPVVKAPVKKAVKPVGFAEKRTPHFVSANISNNATITQVPSFLTLNFDAPLIKSEQTVLTVKKDDINNAAMNTASINDKSLVVRLNTTVTDGNYYVYYVACFADTGCKDGRFGYRVNLP